MLDEKLKGVKLLIKSYTIRSGGPEIIAFNDDRHYDISLEAYVENIEGVYVKRLNTKQILIDPEEVENYTKFLTWCKEKHPEIVIEYEMTKDENKS